MAETGTVKWFDGKKGYGFLTREGDKDVFFHATDLRKSGIEDENVDEGHRFEFELAETPRGVKAIKLVRKDSIINTDANVYGVVADAIIPVPDDDGNIR